MIYLETGAPEKEAAVFVMLPSDGWHPRLFVEPPVPFEVLLPQRRRHQEQARVAGHHTVQLVDLGRLDQLVAVITSGRPVVVGCDQPKP